MYTDISKENFHQIKPRQQEKSGLADYYGKIKLSENEKEKVIGLTASINSKNPPANIDINNLKCYAAIHIYIDEHTNKEVRKYMVKRDSSGYLFNPWGALTEGKEGEKSNNKMGFRWELRQIKEDAFWFYLSFLQTRNEVFLSQASRFSI